MSGAPGPVRAVTPAPPPSNRRQQLVALLDLARADLAAGAFAQAQARAETVLAAGTTPDVRATALTVAGDASYALGAYRMAVERYREVLLSDEVAREAPHATLALGWAELRLGRREHARRTWMQLARQFPADTLTPTALVLAAELSSQAGERMMARRLLDRALEGHPDSPDTGIARLSRSVLAMREGRIEDGTRDLRVLAESGRPSVPLERRRLLDGLAAAAAPAGPERRLFLVNQFESGATPSTAAPREDDNGIEGEIPGKFERFAAPFLDGAGDPETTPYVLHGLVILATEDRAWPAVQTMSRRLVEISPGVGPTLLPWVAARAVSDEQWPIARTSFEQLTARGETGSLSPKARIDFAEALFRTGAGSQARVELVRVMEVAPPAGEAVRALALLADVDEDLDEPGGAIAAYDRLRRSYPAAEWTTDRLFRYARLLQHAIGRQREARTLLEEIVQRTEGEPRTEASFRLAQVLAADGEHRQAVDAYMAAAYGTAERSQWYRPALLGAGHSLVALKRPQAAVVVYRSLLPSPPIGPENVEEPKVAAQAAYAIAEIARGAGRHREAVDMYLTAAAVAPESPWGRRALVGAVRSQVMVGNRAAAETIYRQLVESADGEPEILEQAKQALRARAGETSRRGR